MTPRAIALFSLFAAACTAPGKRPAERPLNPIYDWRSEGRARIVQVRPFYWKKSGPQGERVNILGPLVRYREDAVYRRLEVFPNLFYSARHSPEAERTWWFIFFPILFLGNDDLLLFPLGGVTHGLLGIDELLLVTPFYARTRHFSGPKENRVTYTVRYLFWPFIAWGSDKRPKGRRTFRIAPFYGHTEGRDGRRSGFVLWPFFTWRRKGEAHAFFLFPFYGRSVSPTREETTVLFPFYHHIKDHLTGGTDTAVWPFWRRAGGSDRLEVRRYWPFYEYRRADFTTTEYAAWPFWRRTYIDSPREFGRITWVVPFYRRVVRVSRKEGLRHATTALWPVGRWEHYADGGSEVAIPILLPFDAPALREFAEPFRPFISLYHRRTRANGARESSYLFGLVQARRTKTAKKVRLLGGLLGWERDREGRYLRLLWGIRLRIGASR